MRYFTANTDQLLTDRWMYTNCARDGTKGEEKKVNIQYTEA